MEKQGIRKRIYDVIDITDRQNGVTSVYNAVMTVIIIISLLPLCFKQPRGWFVPLTAVTAAVFVFDYILRWIIADYELGTRGIKAFLRYPFTVNALIDLLSVLPFVIAASTGFRLFVLLRLGRVFRVLRILRYSRVFERFTKVIKKEKDALVAVCILVITYIGVSALIIFSVEPDAFKNFFEAVYWVVITITTVGYGDVVTATVAGRIISMLSALVGMAIIALPTGIITAGYIEEIESNKKQTKKTDEDSFLN